MKERAQILLTNDDGIHSPGLWAAAEALSQIGYVTIVAPREQSSGAGRSQPNGSDGIIHPEILKIGDQEWTAYAVGGTPAQTVQFAVLEIMPIKPDLVVSGINYGENVGSGVTISGTVGAALEAAADGIPAIAVSLEVAVQHQISMGIQIDFSSPAYFTALFAKAMLAHAMPADVDLLKIDVPSQATPQTPWEITRMSRHRYYSALKPQRDSFDVPGSVGWGLLDIGPNDLANDSDAYAVRFKRVVSVTPISLDLTSRVDPAALDLLLRDDSLK
jgi:5'-nucleotidase